MREVIGQWFFWLALSLVTMAILSGAWLAWQATFGVTAENVRTNVIRESRQYTETQQQRALELITEHERLRSVPGSEAQRNYIVQQVRSIADRLGDDVTPEMAQFLRRAR